MSDVKEFRERTQDAQRVIEVVTGTVWENPKVKRRLLYVQYGYETHIPPEVREKMRYLYNETARYIRFAPDFFVLDLENLECLYLLEYKCTRTPVYSKRRISYLRTRACQPGLDWKDIGQWEASAYDNYKALWRIGVRVAILNYCAYHSRPLLCDFVDRAYELDRFQVQTDTRTGSKTPFVNLDLRKFRTLYEFLVQEHQLQPPLSDVVAHFCKKAEQTLLERLPVTHHPASPHRSGAIRERD